MPTDPPTRPNNYFIDAESAEETARLMHQDRLITKSEWGFTNSPAYEQLYTFFANAMKAAGQRFSPERPFLGITPMLGGFLHDIGCVNIQHKAHAIDFSVGTEQYEAFRQNWIVAF